MAHSDCDTSACCWFRLFLSVPSKNRAHVVVNLIRLGLKAFEVSGGCNSFHAAHCDLPKSVCTARTADSFGEQPEYTAEGRLMRDSNPALK